MAKIKILAMCIAKLFLLFVLFSITIYGQKDHKKVAKSNATTALPVHNTLHPNEDDLWSSLEVEYVTIVDVLDGGDVYYHEAGVLFKIRWDLDTSFVVPKNKGRLSIQGCAIMLYCKKHNVVYSLEQIQCLQE